jgi:hypothetical protein
LAVGRAIIPEISQTDETIVPLPELETTDAAVAHLTPLVELDDTVVAARPRFITFAARVALFVLVITTGYCLWQWKQNIPQPAAADSIFQRLANMYISERPAAPQTQPAIVIKTNSTGILPTKH